MIFTISVIPFIPKITFLDLIWTEIVIPWWDFSSNLRNKGKHSDLKMGIIVLKIKHSRDKYWETESDLLGLVISAGL